MMTAAVQLRSRQPGPAVKMRVFGAMVRRDLLVIRREFLVAAVRSIGQPLLLVFVFAYVMPSIGQMTATMPAGAGRVAGRVLPYSTVLLPGAVASTMLITGVVAVMSPLLMELAYSREIEDRLLAPVPAWSVMVEKILAGAIQSIVAGAIVYPLALVIHARGAAPAIHMPDWPLLAAVAVLGALFSATIGLFFGIVADARRGPTLLAVGLLPLTMLGCVYYPWQTLAPIRWLQLATLVNPMVYLSEGLRACLTPGLPHLPLWAVLSVLSGGTVAVAALSTALFYRKVVK
jgi:ABC-2 type transport system permease protein